ncbi:MAG: FAD binding domain-containing protein [Spirochaetia bacterium]
MVGTARAAETLRPRSLEEALEFRARTGAVPFAGGTDLMVKYRGYTGTGVHMPFPVLFLDAVADLRAIEAVEDQILIGAGVTCAQMLEKADVLPELLRRAVELIASPALRTRATMAGNVANASPAGDTIPPLFVHEAEVVLQSPERERRLPVGDFLTGPGTTALEESEIITGFVVPRLPEGRLYYRKVGTRRANALSKLSAAGYARLDGGRIAVLRFAVGAVAPTVVRLREAEKLLAGAEITDIDMQALLAAAEVSITPIDDQRSTAAYRRQVALNSLQEFLSTLADPASSAPASPAHLSPEET